MKKVKSNQNVIFEKTKINDVYNILIEKHEDKRGFFGRIFDKNEFDERGLESKFVQSSISSSIKKGTLRGIHYQVAPNSENKLIRCIKGRAYTVIVDLRKNSSTFGEWDGFEISADNYAMRYIPKGCANGTQILDNNTELFYLTSGFYSDECERGIMWNDPFFNINWPLEISEISEKDQKWKKFDPEKDGI